ncbi:MAG TPA: sec-independent translocase [Trebonia sp.]|nr:sec-independent translocase [Trebonia sp.]
MFDLSITKLLVLAVIALVIFGPNELPRIARQAGRALRDLRQIAEGAKADLREGLGPEFEDFDFEDLNPRRFVQKHLFEEPEPEAAEQDKAAVTQSADVRQPATVAAAGEAAGGSSAEAGTATEPSPGATATAVDIEVDDRPPFDFEAT